MLESIRAPWSNTKGPFFMLSFSQYGGMSRADAIRIGPAFLLPKIGSMANVRCMVSGAKPTFEQFDLTKIELLGGIMKTIMEICVPCPSVMRSMRSGWTCAAKRIVSASR